MKETYVKFTPIEVEAIRDGRKTQARILFKAPRTGEPRCPYGNPGDRILVCVKRGIAPNITLEIEAVRVERLIEITREDCIAEGISEFPGWGFSVDQCAKGLGWKRPEGAYRELWESINGPGSWDLNPWCWVIQFRRVK